MTSPLRIVSAGLAMIAVTYGLARFGYGLFLPEFREAFDLDAYVLGWIGAGSYLGYCATVLVSLLFTARVGPRRMVVAAGSVAVVGMALVAASPNTWVLAVGVLVAGLSSGLASPPMGEAVAKVVSSTGQDRANALINCGTGVGVVLTGPVALFIADEWRVAWAAFAAVGLAVLVWNAAVMPGRITEPSSGGRDDAPRVRLRWFIGRRSAVLFAAAVGIGVSSAVYWTFSRGLVVEAGGLGETGSTLFWVVIGAFGILGGFAGDLVGRLGLTTALRALLLGLAVSTGLLAAAPTVPVVVFASAALFGASYIALSGIVLVWSVSVFADHPAAGIGSAFLLLAAGQALGSPLAGALATVTGPQSTFWIFAGIAIVTMLIGPHPKDARGPTALSG
jgi:predicted MFS family arabinose efflux permease